MGITGTEVSKDAASMVLADDNFATIVKAIGNGRSIYENIKNSVKFLLSGNTAGILAVLYASITNLPVPFAPVHLLFINLLTDSMPAIAIGIESPKSRVLKDKPRNIQEPLLTKPFAIEVLYQGILIAIATMLGFHIGLQVSTAAAVTMAFAVLCQARLIHGFNCRTREPLSFKLLFSNGFSWVAFLVGTLLLGLVLTWRPLQDVFEVASLTAWQYGMLFTLALLPTLVIQLAKWTQYLWDRSRDSQDEVNLRNTV
jgi:Ca2+-transporting ATPase